MSEVNQVVSGIVAGEMHNYGQVFIDLNVMLNNVFKVMYQPTKLLYGFKTHVITEAYMDIKDPGLRQHLNCSCCHGFLNKHAGIFQVDEKGRPYSVLLDMENHTVKDLLKQLQTENAQAAELYVQMATALSSVLTDEQTALHVYKNMRVVDFSSVKNKRFVKDKNEMLPVLGTIEHGGFSHFHIEVWKHPQFDTIMANTCKNNVPHHYRTVAKFLHTSNLHSVETLNKIKTVLTTMNLVARPEILLSSIDWHIGLNNAAAMSGKHKFHRRFNLMDYVIGTVEKLQFKPSGLLDRFIKVMEADDLAAAAKEYNTHVDGMHYMRPTREMGDTSVQQTIDFLKEEGYLESFEIRRATIEEILPFAAWKSSEISNGGAAAEPLKVSALEKAMDNIRGTPEVAKATSDVALPISINAFISKVLPTAGRIYAIGIFDTFVGSAGGIVAHANSDCKPIFKWDSEGLRIPFASYTYQHPKDISAVAIQTGVPMTDDKRYRKVELSAIFPRVSDWTHGGSTLAGTEMLLFVVKDWYFKDIEHVLPIFPENMKSSLHPHRRKIEMLLKNAKMTPSDNGVVTYQLSHKPDSTTHGSAQYNWAVIEVHDVSGVVTKYRLTHWEKY